MAASGEIILERESPNTCAGGIEAATRNSCKIKLDAFPPACPRVLHISPSVATSTTQAPAHLDVAEKCANPPALQRLHLLPDRPTIRSCQVGIKRPRSPSSGHGQDAWATVTSGAPVKSSYWETGLYYDAVHRLHYHPDRKHPERPERVETILAHLASRGVLDKLTVLGQANAVEYSVMAGVHNRHYLRRLRRWENRGAAAVEGSQQDRDQLLTKLQEEAEQFDSVYLNASSVTCARRATGGLLLLVDRVVGTVGPTRSPKGVCPVSTLSETARPHTFNKVSDSTIHKHSTDVSHSPPRLRNGLALIRPPGHHAESHSARGFCLVNSVAVAAKHAREHLGLSKVLICDWDVHHGQGTQEMFWNDPSVLYFSVHRHDHGRFWPGSGSPERVGEGKGEGYTINVAWNQGGMGDAEYRQVWKKILLPVARAFAPELILVSAGFDGAQGDPMGGCEITPRAGFGTMARMLVEGVPSAEGRVVLALEGGYRLSILGECVEACLEALTGASEGGGGGKDLLGEDDLRDGTDVVILEDAAEAIEKTIAVHGKYWACLEKEGNGLKKN